MHSLEEIFGELRKDSNLCEAVEKGGILCFKEKKSGKYCYKHHERKNKYNCFDPHVREIKRCKFIDCNNKYFSNDYCSKHYTQYAKKKSISKIKCSVEKCNNPRHGYGLCTTHQLRLKKYGDINIVHKSGFAKGYTPSFTGKVKFKKCIVPGCNIKHGDQKRKIVKGLCGKHYLRWIRHGDYNITLCNRD